MLITFGLCSKITRYIIQLFSSMKIGGSTTSIISPPDFVLHRQ